MKRAAQLVVLLAWLPVFFLLWLVFVGTFSLHELLVGTIATFLAMVGMVVVTVEYPARFSPRLSDVLACWRLPWYLISGTSEVWLVAAKDLLGIERAASVFRIAPFRAGTKDDPHASARRSLAVIYTTAAPNFIVLGVNTSNQKMLFHQIQRSSVPKMTEQLGAQQ